MVLVEEGSHEKNLVAEASRVNKCEGIEGELLSRNPPMNGVFLVTGPEVGDRERNQVDHETSREVHETSQVGVDSTEGRVGRMSCRQRWPT